MSLHQFTLWFGLLTAGLTACGPKVDGSLTVLEEADKRSMIFSNRIALESGRMGRLVVLSSVPNLCASLEARAKYDGSAGNPQFFNFALSDNQTADADITVGTYAVGSSAIGKTADAVLESIAVGRCLGVVGKQGDHTRTGSITLTTASASQLTGSFEMQSGAAGVAPSNDRGDFSASLCPALDGALALDSLGCSAPNP